MLYVSRYVILAWVAAGLTCCQRNQGQTKLPPDTTKQGNIYTTHSRDTARLSRLVNLQLYKPHAVQFHYTYIDNSGGDDFLSVPGPSDSYLEAVLYFDSATYSQLLKVCNDPPQELLTTNHVSKGDFDFNWLPADVKEELLQSDSNHHNYTCTPFQASLWILNKKILLKKESR